MSNLTKTQIEILREKMQKNSIQSGEEPDIADKRGLEDEHDEENEEFFRDSSSNDSSEENNDTENFSSEAEQTEEPNLNDGKPLRPRSQNLKLC